MKSEASPGAQKRFINTMDLFFKAVTVQAHHRAAGVIPNLEDYIAMRRDTSGCKPSWALVEYGYGLDLPDEVMDNSIVQSLGEAANDLVTWSNVSGCQMQFLKPMGYPRVDFCFASLRTSSLTTVNNPRATLTT